MQLDIILTSLQDHTHVASLLGYSSPTDAPEVHPSSTGFTASPDPAYGTTAGHPDTHLAEILMKTLLRNLGFYTVSTWHKSSRELIDRGIVLMFLELTDMDIKSKSSSVKSSSSASLWF